MTSKTSNSTAAALPVHTPFILCSPFASLFPSSHRLHPDPLSYCRICSDAVGLCCVDDLPHLVEHNSLGVWKCPGGNTCDSVDPPVSEQSGLEGLPCLTSTPGPRGGGTMKMTRRAPLFEMFSLSLNFFLWFSDISQQDLSYLWSLFPPLQHLH